ncbi:hypothetical protein NDU88_001512 [Pleurodeles waltl]|uniref:Uncharacterized protein n=1 Tax=Pleurodeles waltl TaxID=8319 RepID=A0AAV7P7E2_PLEWA|nr:hypothetical protein NDU88_001512 [Pleurodeles waltl]
MNLAVRFIFVTSLDLKLLQENFSQPRCPFDLPAVLAASVIHCIFGRHSSSHIARMPARGSKAAAARLVARQETAASSSGALKDLKGAMAGDRGLVEPANARAPAVTKITVAPLTKYLKKRNQAEMSLPPPTNERPTLLKEQKASAGRAETEATWEVSTSVRGSVPETLVPVVRDNLGGLECTRKMIV